MATSRQGFEFALDHSFMEKNFTFRAAVLRYHKNNKHSYKIWFERFYRVPENSLIFLSSIQLDTP